MGTEAFFIGWAIVLAIIVVADIAITHSKRQK